MQIIHIKEPDRQKAQVILNKIVASKVTMEALKNTGLMVFGTSVPKAERLTGNHSCEAMARCAIKLLEENPDGDFSAGTPLHMYFDLYSKVNCVVYFGLSPEVGIAVS